MVSVTGKTLGIGSKEVVGTEIFLERMSTQRSPEEVERIHRACVFAERAHAGQERASGEPYFQHVLAVAQILVELNLDSETIAAAILHDVVEDTPVRLEEIEREFGGQVAMLVNGVTKMRVIHEFSGQAETGRKERAQAENLRKMLLAMAEDVRVVLIKLADRLHNMRTLASLPEDKQTRIARETMDIFAPLANRLGIWQLKWELEDLAFRYLESVAYKRIAGMLAERRVDREDYIAAFVATLARELKQNGVDAEITGRPKHIYSIWRKMQRKGVDFGQVFDVRAVRILVPTVRDCYTALGIVHAFWPYISGEFDDYIATPKENNYRSIHTAVIGPEGKIVEVQIRTIDMHHQSELGVAAHWHYKEDVTPDTGYEKKIAWLRQLLEWKDEVVEAGDFVDRFKSELFGERVYVFTPAGNIVDLPRGATPLDFAYAIHTDVGHRCRGAKADGRIVPLTYTLKTGEQVEVLTVKAGRPSRDWLSPHLGYLTTPKARAKVQRWFKQQNLESSVPAGRAELEREFRRLGIVDVNYDALARNSGFGKIDDFLAAIGQGRFTPTQIAAAVQQLTEPVRKDIRPAPGAAERALAPAPVDVTVQGVGQLLTRMGKCCNPVPGDPITGFITRGQGVTIHRRDCPNALRHHDEHGERLIEVNWGAESGRAYPVDVEITAYERAGLLRDITSVLANANVNVLAVNTLTDKHEHIARMRLTLEVYDLGTLSRMLAIIDQIPNVTEITRKIN